MAQAHFALRDLEAAVERGTRVATLLPMDRTNLRILVAALVESGRVDEARRHAAPLMADGEIDLSWIAISPWPKPTLARVEAALSRLGPTRRH
jgi:hypothetical protein